jgi:hypothetical protein
MHGEMLLEARVANLVLQFGLGPGVLRIRGQVWREGQGCAVQIQKADDGDQSSGVEISLAS